MSDQHDDRDTVHLDATGQRIMARALRRATTRATASPAATEMALAKAIADYEALSPVDKALHDAEQRRSFVRGHAGHDPGPNVLAAEVIALRAERDRLREALERVQQWADAYPPEVFPEPDFKRAHEVLTAAGMALDAISASNMRHCMKGVREIARAALAEGRADGELP